MKAIAFPVQGLWWLPAIAATLLFLFWQRHRLRLSSLRWAAFTLLLLALLDPVVILCLNTTEKVDFNLQVIKPRILLAEYGGGKTYLGTVLGEGSLNHTDIVSPENLPLVADLAKRYDMVVMHTAKNLQVYTDFFTDWQSFPNRGKLETVFTDYGVVFDNGTNSLPQNLDDYGLIVIAGADIKPEDTERLLDYTKRGGRLLILFHAGGGLAVNPPGTDNPYCILYHHPPYGDTPFPADWLQRNVANMLQDRLGVRSMENISCIYGKLVVKKSDLSALHTIYGEGSLYPSSKIDGKDFDKLDWTTVFLDYDPAWQPVLTIDIKQSGEPRGHGTPVLVPINGKPAGMARQYGDGRIFVFGWGPINYGRNGIAPSLLLAAAPYIGTDVTYYEQTSRALMSYVAEGGNLVVIGPSIPKSSEAVKFSDLLPVSFSGPQIAEATKAVFRNPSHPLLANLPPIAVSHYRVAKVKATGEVLAVDGKNNPVLVTSYYGLGRVLYYLPEIPVRATLDNTTPPEFWRRLVSWLMPEQTEAPGFNAGLTVQPSNQVPVSLHLWDDNGKPVEKAKVSADYTSSQGDTETSPLTETSRGTYTAQLPFSTPGDYHLSFNIKSGTAIKTPPVSFSLQVSGLSALEQATWKGIAFLNGYQTATPTAMPLPLWQLLVLVGVSLLCLDWTTGILKGRL